MAVMKMERKMLWKDPRLMVYELTCDFVVQLWNEKHCYIFFIQIGLFLRKKIILSNLELGRGTYWYGTSLVPMRFQFWSYHSFPISRQSHFNKLGHFGSSTSSNPTQVQPSGNSGILENFIFPGVSELPWHALVHSFIVVPFEGFIPPFYS